MQSTASMVFAAGSFAVGSEVASPHAWVGEIRAGCDTAEFAAITWACRWCTYRMCVEPSMCGLLVVLHVDQRTRASCCLWSGLLGILDIRGTSWRRRLLSRRC